MKNSIKRITALMLVLAMVLMAMAGCGGAKDTSSTKPENSSSESGDYLTTKGDLGAGLKVKNLKNKKLTIMGATDLNALAKFDRPNSPYTAYQKCLTWKETYGVELESVSITAADLVAAYAADNMPDIIDPSISNMRSVAMDLKDKGVLDDELFFPQYNELFEWAGLSNFVVGTKQIQRHYIIFNETRFVNEGQKTPLDWYKEGKWTLSQFRKTAKAMTNIANDQYGFTGNELSGANSPYAACKWDDMGRLTLDLKNKNYITFMTEMNKVYEDKSIRTDNKASNWREEFPNGNDAMLIANEYEFSEICRKAKLKGGNDFGIAPMFVSDVTGETRPYYQSSQMGHSISAKCKNLEGAIEFLRIEAYVNRQMNEKLGQFNSAEQYLTEDERKALVDSLEDKISVRPLWSISEKAKELIRSAEWDAANFVSKLDSVSKQLQQEVDEYNSKIK